MGGGGGGVWSGGKHVTWDMLTCTAKLAAEFAVCLALRVVSDLYVRGEWSQSEYMAVFAQIMSLFFLLIPFLSFFGSRQTITWQSVISLLVNIMPFSILLQMRKLKHNLVKESTCFSCILLMHGSGNFFSSIEFSFVFCGDTVCELSC